MTNEGRSIRKEVVVGVTVTVLGTVIAAALLSARFSHALKSAASALAAFLTSFHTVAFRGWAWVLLAGLALVGLSIIGLLVAVLIATTKGRPPTLSVPETPLQWSDLDALEQQVMLLLAQSDLHDLPFSRVVIKTGASQLRLHQVVERLVTHQLIWLGEDVLSGAVLRVTNKGRDFVLAVGLAS